MSSYNSERRCRFFGDKAGQCLVDPRQKLFGTVSLRSRDFLCLGVTSELIFVAAVVLKGFQRKTAPPVLLLGAFFCGRGDERLAVFGAGGRA
jgi:hypothetical protein